MIAVVPRFGVDEKHITARSVLTNMGKKRQGQMHFRRKSRGGHRDGRHQENEQCEDTMRRHHRVASPPIGVVR